MERRVDKTDQPASICFQGCKVCIFRSYLFFYAITINFGYVLYEVVQR